MGLKSVNLRHSKLTKSKRSEVGNVPKKVVLPLQQHIGSPCNAIVKEGDMLRQDRKLPKVKILFQVLFMLLYLE